MGLWPTQADENQLLFSNHSPGSTALPFVIPRACDLIPVSVEATRMEQCFAMGRSAKRQLGQGAVAHCLAGHTVLDPFCFRGARSFLLIQLGFS
jgi:hypothetical protein